MLSKKDKILAAALALFASSGYNAVSTSKIAKEAGVSEGLIFRHYKNKQGLLDTILQQAFEKAANIYAHIITEPKPKQTLYKAITLPFKLEKSEYHFWKLLFKLKWELEIAGTEKTQPLVEKLTWALTELNYEEPAKEAQVLYHITESIFSAILKDGIKTQEPLKGFLLKKYKVQL